MSSFHIEKVEISKTPNHVDVHVRYDGGATVMQFPDTYPRTTILANVKNEIRTLLNQADTKKRLAGLVGRHDL